MERLPLDLLKKKIATYKKKECKPMPRTKPAAIAQINAINKRNPGSIKFSSFSIPPAKKAPAAKRVYKPRAKKPTNRVPLTKQQRVALSATGHEGTAPLTKQQRDLVNSLAPKKKVM